jgi:hypothetical protein
VDAENDTMNVVDVREMDECELGAFRVVNYEKK